MGLKVRFRDQRRTAWARGIVWKLTFEQWLKIWTDSGHLHERGRRHGQYCMSRKGDRGPYAVSNVVIKLSSENNSEGHKGIPSWNKGVSNWWSKGVAPWNKGKRLSDETREKMRVARRRWLREQGSYVE